jgi:hypothetical protein
MLGGSIRKVSLVVSLIMAVFVGELSSQPVEPRDLLELAAAERAFAAETVKVGFRDGFIKYFADDGIGFGPHPERTKEVLQKRPASTGPRTVVFNWAPMLGHVSQAGDLGYTTGPILFTDLGANPKPPWHGIYFSVWQKQADGTWKVAIDMGVDTPEAVAPINTGFSPAVAFESGRPPNPMRGTPEDDFRRLDSNLSDSIAKRSPADGYGSFLNRLFRVHRKGMMPITDIKHLNAVLSQTKFEFIDGKV